MNTVIAYNVMDKSKVLETRSFIVDYLVDNAKDALKAAESDYKGDGEIQIQGYIGVTDEELASGNITRVVG